MCANGIQKRAFMVSMILSLTTIKCFNQYPFIFKSTATMVLLGLGHGIVVNPKTSPLTSRKLEDYVMRPPGAVISGIAWEKLDSILKNSGFKP